MVTLMISHEVKNYAEWKKAFDGHDAVRTQAGIKITGVYSSVDNANHVTVISEAPSMEAVNALMSNPDMKTVMEKAGVISKPEIKILNSMN